MSNLPIPQVKVKFLGSTGVGKSTLIETLKCGLFSSFFRRSRLTSSGASPSPSHNRSSMKGEPITSWILSWLFQMYCIENIDQTLQNKLHGPRQRTLTEHSRINYMDHCITKQVLHVYTMDTCSILCCNNMTI